MAWQLKCSFTLLCEFIESIISLPSASLLSLMLILSSEFWKLLGLLGFC